MALLLPAAIYSAAYRASVELKKSTGSAAHSQEIMLGLDQVALKMAAAEDEQNRYLINADPSLLTSYRKRVSEARQELTKLQQLTSDDPAEQASLNILRAGVDAQAIDLQQSVMLAQAGHPNRAYELVNTAGALRREEAIRNDAAAAVEAENELLNQRRAQARQYERLWPRLFWGACFVSLGLLIMVYSMAIREIRKRRRAQEALALSHAQLEESWRRYHSLISNVPAAVWTVARDGATEFISSQIEAIAGYSAAEVIKAGCSFWPERIHPEDRNRVLAGFDRLFADDQTQRRQFSPEFRVLHKSGEWVWVQVQGQYVQRQPELGQPVADGVLYDVGEVKQRAELEMRRRELEIRDREMQRGYQFKNDFLASVSHELRTPLSAILGFSDLLEQEIGGRLNDEQRSFAQSIHRSGEHLLALINDVLDLSRIEAGAMPLNAEAVGVPQAALEAMQTIGKLAADKGIELTSSLAPDLTVWADPVRFRQILLNLLSNAVKYTPPEGKVRLEARVNAADQLELKVTDSGVGIAAQDLPFIFDRFRQVGGSAQAHKGGAGLGLAITKHLVERHGGQIAVSSAPGQGSCFTVTLPLTAPGAPVEAQARGGA